MAGIDPQHDPRGARWEQRLRVPVLGAALLAATAVVGILTGDKHPSPFHGAWGLVETLPLWSLVLALGRGRRS